MTTTPDTKSFWDDDGVHTVFKVGGRTEFEWRDLAAQHYEAGEYEAATAAATIARTLSL